MHETDHIFFSLLKQKVVAVMKRSYPGIAATVAEWKGQEITDFIEDLRVKVNAHVSEKWFYTHMKASNSTLPRIDMLNILSKYAGYANWADFVHKNQTDNTGSSLKNTSNRYFILIPSAAILILGLLFVLYSIYNTRDYVFTFYDADTKEQVKSDKTEIILFLNDESPVNYMVDKDGELHFRTDQSKIKMVVNAPCYKLDTINRIVKKLNKHESIMLKPDDYALMIQYFSTMKVDDWEKRRNKLNGMIDDDAMICQVISRKDISGVALYNKQEFIDKLTIPIGSLRNIEILRLQMRKDKIVVLRFRINDQKR